MKRCYALSGVYDLRRLMDGGYDDNFYFHNPVDYLANLSDPWYFEQLATCEIRLATGSGPYEESRYTYALAGVLSRKGIRHYLDDWGPLGGHDWPTGRSDAGCRGVIISSAGRQPLSGEAIEQILPVRRSPARRRSRRRSRG